MRVLYLGGFELPDKNAAAQRVLSNAKLLREIGFEVKFIGISKDLKTSPSNVEGFRSTPIAYPSNIVEWVRHICTFVDSRSIKDFKPDFVVLYNFPAIASLKFLRVCHRNGIKVIHDLTEWESNNGWSPSDFIRRIDIGVRMHFCINRMDGVIAISRYLYDYYKYKVKTIQVPPTVDLTSKKWNRNRSLTSNKPIKLVYAGSPGGIEKDRLDLIVDEVQRRSNLCLNIIGLTEDQFYDSFHKQRSHYNNIYFKGRLSHEEALKEVSDADFQMLIRDQSLKNNAGFPTKFVESMACGTPVIATNVSNISDFLTDGINGFIVNEKYNLGNVLERIEILNNEKIIKMKEQCLNLEAFDYRNYKSEFKKIFY